MYLLRLSLVGSLILMIDATEIGHDHRNRKCYDQYAAQRTNSADNLADDRSRHHVTVAVQQDHKQLARQLHTLTASSINHVSSQHGVRSWYPHRRWGGALSHKIDVCPYV